MMSRLLLVAILFLQGAPLQRAQPGTIAGTIHFMDGRPAAGVRVTALAVLDAPGQRADAAIMSIAQTDSDGRYRLEGVPPGRYYIAQGRVNAPTYFPGVAALTSATVVTVSSGAALSDLNFRVPPVVRVSGRVNRPDSATSGATALLLARLPFQVRLIGGGITDLIGAVSADGLFEINSAWRVSDGLFARRWRMPG